MFRYFMLFKFYINLSVWIGNGIAISTGKFACFEYWPGNLLIVLIGNVVDSFRFDHFIPLW